MFNIHLQKSYSNSEFSSNKHAIPEWLAGSFIICVQTSLLCQVIWVFKEQKKWKPYIQ